LETKTPDPFSPCKAPEGQDAMVWDQMKKADFVYFLHSGAPKDQKKDAIDTALAILRTTPNTRYRPVLRNALAEYYAARRRELNRDVETHDEELQRIRDVLGLGRVAGPERE